MAHRYTNMKNYNGQYQTKVDTDCCDHYAHKINGRWECGIGPGVCDGQYSSGGYPKKTGYINEGSTIPRADDVRAMLSHGEFVQQKTAVDKYGVNFMERLNKGMVSQEVMHMNTGGKVNNNSRRNNMHRTTRNRISRPISRARKSTRRSMGRNTPRNFGYGGSTRGSSRYKGRGRKRMTRRTSPVGRRYSGQNSNKYVKTDFAQSYGNQDSFWISDTDGQFITAYDCPTNHFTKECGRISRTSIYAQPRPPFFGPR